MRVVLELLHQSPKHLFRFLQMLEVSFCKLKFYRVNTPARSSVLDRKAQMQHLMEHHILDGNSRNVLLIQDLA